MRGFLNKLLKQEETAPAVCKDLKAYVNGTSMALADVKDGVFSEGVLGEGMAIRPSDGMLVAPCDGVICVVAETKHAVGIEMSNGAQVLLHIGLDTVTLEGRGFDVLVKNGQKVTTGQKLVSFDRDVIRQAGFSDTVILVVVKNERELSLSFCAYGEVEAGKSTVVELNE